MERIVKIVTHRFPHLDEVAAIWLLKKFGEEVFPGVAEAPVEYLANGGETPDGRNAEEYEREGTLLIGVGGGRFDEHPRANGNGEKKENECAATLVAEALGIAGDPALEQILKNILKTDLKGGSQILDLATLVKLLHQQCPERPDLVMEWTFVGLEAKYQEQRRFWGATKEEFQRSAQVKKMQGPNGEPVNVVIAQSDNEQMGQFARSPHGANAAVVIQKRANGQVQIFTSKKQGVCIEDAVRIIRIEEQSVKDEWKTTDWKDLVAEGKVAGAEEWYYHKEGRMLLNGSTTATDVPPTKLSLEDITRAVEIGLDTTAFRFERCAAEGCRSSRQRQCRWYDWGLGRCRTVRFNQRNNEANGNCR